MGPRSAAHAWLAYAGPSFAEQSRVVGALSLILWLFQTLVLRQPVYHPERVLFGLLLVSCGLFVFLEGVKLGVQPLASELGATLPKQLKLRWVLLVVFVLGCGATLAEPAMGALRNLDKLISPSRAPLLNAMLSRYTVALNAAVALGVGLAAVTGTLMLLRSWSLQRVLAWSLLPPLCLSVASLRDPQLQQVVGLAWDTGAVTTGPVTVPIVLALGAGLSRFRTSEAGGGGIASAATAVPQPDATSGFGIVALAGVHPVTCVLSLAFYLHHVHGDMSGDKTIRTRDHTPDLDAHVPWWAHDELLVLDDVLDALRAGLPLVGFLVGLQMLVLRRPLPQVELPWRRQKTSRADEALAVMGELRRRDEEHVAALQGQVAAMKGAREARQALEARLGTMTVELGEKATAIATLEQAAGRTASAGWGLLALLVGLCTFEIGLKFGLVALGYQCGVAVPAAFSPVQSDPDAPLYPQPVGLTLVGCYALLLGGCGTLAEPAMLAFAGSVDALAAAGGSRPLLRAQLIGSTAAGVALGLLVSLLKLLFSVPFLALLLPLTALAALLSVRASGVAAGIAWDSAGVTTGEVTTPLILALGLGIAKAARAPEGFGLLALASLGPVVSVLFAVRLSQRERGVAVSPRVSPGLGEALLSKSTHA